MMSAVESEAKARKSGAASLASGPNLRNASTAATLKPVSFCFIARIKAGIAGADSGTIFPSDDAAISFTRIDLSFSSDSFNTSAAYCLVDDDLVFSDIFNATLVSDNAAVSRNFSSGSFFNTSTIEGRIRLSNEFAINSKAISPALRDRDDFSFSASESLL